MRRRGALPKLYLSPGAWRIRRHGPGAIDLRYAAQTRLAEGELAQLRSPELDPWLHGLVPIQRTVVDAAKDWTKPPLRQRDLPISMYTKAPEHLLWFSLLWLEKEKLLWHEKKHYCWVQFYPIHPFSSLEFAAWMLAYERMTPRQRVTLWREAHFAVYGYDLDSELTPRSRFVLLLRLWREYKRPLADVHTLAVGECFFGLVPQELADAFPTAHIAEFFPILSK